MSYTAARKAMIDSQIRPNDVTDPHLVAAIAAVAREQFVPKSVQSLAYSEAELATGDGRALWAPRDFAKLLKAADPKPTDIALVIAAGEGYAAAVLGQLVETVIALEADEAIVEETGKRLLKAGAERVVAVKGELEHGYPKEGPYDLVFVNGAVEYVPDAWLQQLSEGGRLAAVIGNGNGGVARVYTKAGDAVSFRSPFDASPPSLPEFKVAESFVF